MTPGEHVGEAAPGVGAVLRVQDMRTGLLVAVPPPGRRGLRLRVHLACPAGRVGWTEVRVLVVADELVRTLEAAGVQVFPAVTVPELAPEEAKALDRALACYGVHLPEADDDPRADVHVHTGRDPVPDRPGARLRVGAVDVAAGLPDPVSFGPGEEAQVRRLALLGTAYREPLALDAAVLRDAAARLTGWQTLVRAWSRSPSTAVPAALREQARQALAADLDTPRLLNLLQRTADDEELAEGAPVRDLRVAGPVPRSEPGP